MRKSTRAGGNGRLPGVSVIFPLSLSLPLSFLLPLLFISGATSSSSSSPLRKCCPPGEILSSERTGGGCIAANWYSGKLEDLEAGGTGFPECEDPEDLAVTLLDDESTARNLSPGHSAACLEVLRGLNSTRDSTLVLVHCGDGGGTGEIPGIFSLRRCCPVGNRFDGNARTCVPVAGSHDESLVPMLPRMPPGYRFIFTRRGPPRCEHAIFDYLIDTADLSSGTSFLKAKIASLNNEVDKEEFALTGENACLEMLTESTTETKLVIRTCRGAEFCSKKPCVQKCCPEDETFLNKCYKFEAPVTEVQFHPAVSSSLNNTNLDIRDYGILVGMPCKHGMYPVLPEEEWIITSKGRLYVPDYKVYEYHEHCIDILYNNSEMQEALYPFVCFESPLPEEYSTMRFKINGVLELTSTTFLLLTLLVYACLPALQNLHGKTLMCHVSSLSVAYICLAVAALATPTKMTYHPGEQATVICQFIGYTMLFSFLSAFSWLNVMCFDIWWTFGNFRGRSIRGRGERKKFLLYCLYAFGMALFICTSGIIADFTNVLPYYLLPHIGEDRCWFAHESADINVVTSQSYGELVFFIGPITIQLISNIIFFVLTSINCTKVKAEIRRVADPSDPRSKRFHADRTKFLMNVKLFIVMGISWIMEVISYFLNKYAKDLSWVDGFFYVTDVVNCLQGLLIFILFVMKSRVYLSLRRRLGLSEKKRSTVGSNGTATLQDPYKVKKSASSSTLTSTFTTSMAP